SLSARGVPFTAFWVINTVLVPQGTLRLARSLAMRPEVARIAAEPVFFIPPVTIQEPGGTVQSIGWNIDKIRTPQVWDLTKGAGIVVASIDTGVRYTHTALINQYRGSSGGGNFDHAGNWSDPTGVCGASPCDNTSHGTHTMGTLVGDDGGANPIGVAPEAQWIACKGCTNNTCYGQHLISCGQWILDPNGDGSGDDQPDVVNNSWAGGSGDTWFLSTVDSWRAAGIFPAFAAGNTGPACGSTNSPGDYPQSFSSAATDINDLIAGFSSRGPSAFGGTKPDVSAPGVGIRSSTADSDTSYQIFNGTSMASPHTAGTVALMWAADPTLRAQITTTEQMLRDSAVDLGPGDCGGTLDANYTYGNGRIDAAAAAATVPPPANNPPVVTISAPTAGTTFNCPATVDFAGTANDSEDGNLTNDLAWSDNGISFGTGGNPAKNYTCSESGAHAIEAAVTDSEGLAASDTLTIQVNNSLPTVTIVSPSNASEFGPCPVTVNFGGVANDPEDGDITAGISWSDNGSFFGSGNATSKTFTCTQIGPRTIQASVADSGGANAGDSITINITGPQNCVSKGAACNSDNECCTGKCRGRDGIKVCK
ncbi:MAG: S8 family serine peptidase, partial [Gammaproteobacteria bacterium]